jgi:hypothetical protein
MMELGKFKTLSMEIKDKEILLSVLLIVQLGETILWHCPFLLQIKSMMELGEFMMLSSEMKNKEILRSVPLLIPLGEDFTRVRNKAHHVAWISKSYCATT